MSSSKREFPDTMSKFKPGVTRKTLIIIAGLMWLGVGIMLQVLAYSWLMSESGTVLLVFAGIGIVVALLVHHFGFLKIVDKNLKRLLPLEGERCVFSFITWKSYIMIAVMVSMGLILRHSSLPKHYLAVVYIGIGMALMLSSIRYIRFFIKELINL